MSSEPRSGPPDEPYGCLGFLLVAVFIVGVYVLGCLLVAGWESFFKDR